MSIEHFSMLELPTVPPLADPWLEVLRTILGGLLDCISRAGLNVILLCKRLPLLFGVDLT